MVKSKGIKDYKKYRWFITSDKVLVIGGKNAEQNEQLIRQFVKQKCKYIVMHTMRPGSPFSIIISENPSKKDLEEAAIFTGCFSRGWKECRKEMMIDVFLLEQMVKEPSMKEGTFRVLSKIEHKPITLKLYLTKQNGKLRAVPFEVKDSTSIIPGKIDKDRFAEQISVKLEISLQEVVEALPSGKSDFFSTTKKKIKKKVVKNKPLKKVSKKTQDKPGSKVSKKTTKKVKKRIKK